MIHESFKRVCLTVREISSHWMVICIIKTKRSVINVLSSFSSFCLCLPLSSLFRFLLQCLEDLDANLRKLNSRLFVIRGQPANVFPRLFKVSIDQKLTALIISFKVIIIIIIIIIITVICLSSKKCQRVAPSSFSNVRICRILLFFISLLVEYRWILDCWSGKRAFEEDTLGYGGQTVISLSLSQEWKISRLTFEYDSEPFGKERDAAIKKLAMEAGVEVIVKISHTLYDLDK